MQHKEWSRPEFYRAEYPQHLQTPALVIYEDYAVRNMQITLNLLGGDASRWRPHLKTVKSEFIMRKMVELGITRAKCAGLQEARSACASGISDILVAMPLVGPAVPALLKLQAVNPDVDFSALVESLDHVAQWRGTGFRLFLDINGGMNRTGVPQERVSDILAIVRAIGQSGCRFAGLHYYDGHITDVDLDERFHRASAGYGQLVGLIDQLLKEGLAPEEVITSGTTSFPCALRYSAFQSQQQFQHVCSPGTLSFHDLTSLSQLPEEWGYRPAALVWSRVISHPEKGRLTLDAGSKAVSVDLGIPSGLILELAGAEPLKPSEEHLPVVLADSAGIEIGTLVRIVPRHVCTTVHNFDYCVVVRDGNVVGAEEISARGRGLPI